MTVRNGSAYISEAVESLLQQTDGCFEVVVADDGSTDDTRRILEGIRDARLRVIELDSVGRAAALAEAVRHTRGALIAILDADDVALPHRLERQRAFLDSHRDVALVGSAAIDFDDRREWRRRVVSGPRQVRRALGMYNPFYHSSVMFRRAAYDAIGGYRPDGGWGHDKDLVMRFAKSFAVDIIPEPLIRYRHHAGQLTTSEGETFRRRKSARLQLRAAKELGLPAPLWIVPLLAFAYAYLPPALRPTALKRPVKQGLLRLAGVAGSRPSGGA